MRTHHNCWYIRKQRVGGGYKTVKTINQRGNEPITTVIIVALGLRFMGGEITKSLADVFGMSDLRCSYLIFRCN